MATALTYGGTVDQLANLDLGYAPPYSTAIDVAEHAANVARNKQDGLAAGLSPLDVKEKMALGEDFVLLDVRTPQEWAKERIEDPRVKSIPLGKLRARLGELPKDKEIVTLCKLSLRGYEARTILAGAGFKDVKFLDGGLAAWPFDGRSKAETEDEAQPGQRTVWRAAKNQQAAQFRFRRLPAMNWRAP